MRKLFFIFLFVFISIPLVHNRVQAQDIETGMWSGMIMPPGSDALDINIDVSVESDTLKMTLLQERFGRLPLMDIVVSDDGLNFYFDAGVRVLCDLKLKANKGYEGECAPEGQEPGILVMNPPKKGDN